MKTDVFDNPGPDRRDWKRLRNLARHRRLREAGLVRKMSKRELRVMGEQAVREFRG